MTAARDLQVAELAADATVEKGTSTRETLSDGASDEIVGERGITPVSQERSLQTRIHNGLAVALVVLVGGGFLTWYYAHLATKHRDEQVAAQKPNDARNAGELNLPPLGRIDLPSRSDAAADASATPAEGLREGPPENVSSESSGLLERPPEPDVDEIVDGDSVAAMNSPATPSPATRSPATLALERQLSSPVLWRPSSTPAFAGLPTDTAGAVMPPGLDGAPALAPAPSADSVAARLTAATTPAVRAERLPTQKLLLPKGAFIDCTLETAIDSTLPGLATCVTASDVFGSDGEIVLLERGTKLVGEIRSDVRAGQARVFVLWNEARTPTGVVVALASPATDALGRTGIPGAVDTHFDERFGAAILVSVIEGAIDAAVASQQQSSDTAIVVSPQSSSQIATEILKSTVSISPTVRVAQGTRVQVLVARDVDFRSVYALIRR